MGLWDSVKKDIKKGLQEGIAVVKQGAAVAVVKAEELAEEGKKKYKIFELKQKIHSNFADLGGRIYDLSHQKSIDPLNDKKVKTIISGIKKLEADIRKIKKPVPKKPVKPAAPKEQ